MSVIDLAKKALMDSAKSKYPGYNITNTEIYFREYDNTFEILGLVSDPTIDPKDFQGREILFPKKWVTLNTHTLEELNEY